MHRSLYRGLAGLCLGLALMAATACGQKGPLFMPPAASPAADDPSDTPTESPTESPTEPDEDQAEPEEE